MPSTRDFFSGAVSVRRIGVLLRKGVAALIYTIFGCGIVSGILNTSGGRILVSEPIEDTARRMDLHPRALDTLAHGDIRVYRKPNILQAFHRAGFLAAQDFHRIPDKDAQPASRAMKGAAFMAWNYPHRLYNEVVSYYQGSPINNTLAPMDQASVCYVTMAAPVNYEESFGRLLDLKDHFRYFTLLHEANHCPHYYDGDYKYGLQLEIDADRRAISALKQAYPESNIDQVIPLWRAFMPFQYAGHDASNHATALALTAYNGPNTAESARTMMAATIYLNHVLQEKMRASGANDFPPGRADEYFKAMAEFMAEIANDSTYHDLVRHAAYLYLKGHKALLESRTLKPAALGV